MYKIYETYDKKIPSYHTAKVRYNKSPDKRLNLQFRICDNLENTYFSKESEGDKSILYDLIQIVLEEFQLSDLSDEQLWSIMLITWKTLKKRYSNYMYVVINETLEEVEKYLKEEKINYGKLGKYGRPSDIQPEIWQTHPNQFTDPRGRHTE